MPLKNSYWPLLLARLSDGSCRIAVNQDPRGRRASFDGNASLLALLCTPSCRNTPGGPHRSVPLSRDTRRRRRAYGNASLQALPCTPSYRNTPGPPRTGPLSRYTVAAAHLVAAAAHLVAAAAMVGTRPECQDRRQGGRRAALCGCQPHSG